MQPANAVPARTHEVEQYAHDTAAPPVLPNQQELFVGMHVYEQQAKSALLALDAIALQTAISEAGQAWPRSDLPASWAVWVETIERQLDPPEIQLQRALVLDDEELSRLLPGASSLLASTYRHEALTQAATAHIAIHGPAARLPDGRAAAELFIDAEKLETAADALAAALAAGSDDGHTRSCLATVLWTLGRHREALTAQRDALLYDPAGVRESEIKIPPLLDLLDDLDDLEDVDCFAGDEGGEDLLPWLPIFADLRGLVRLPRDASPASPAAPPPRQVAALLVDLRLEPEPAQRIRIKRRIGNHAAWLKAHVRAR